MIAPAINQSNARALQQKSVESRKRNAEIARLAKIGAATVEYIAPAKPANPSADELACAQAELLAELRATPQAKDKAALSQAIKNLRETWHMETGQPKPGTIKPERTSSRSRMTARPPEPEPIDPSSTP